MAKTIIALQGKSNTGKTKTLGKLIDKNFKAIYKPVFEETASKDKIAAFEINKKRIGITTRGDNRAALEQDFERLGQCDLYVCACRSKGETVDFLKEVSGGDHIVFHGRWYINSANNDFSEDIENAHESQANMLYDEIMRLI